MNINLDLYRIFYVVATNGSISKAADNLFISQPAVTFQIKNLEDQLGISLFVRTKHGVVLTDEGKILYDYVKKVIEIITNGENALTNLKNLDSGLLRIGASTTVSRHVLMPYLECFHEKYPNIDIQIVNNLTDNLIKDLRNGNLDILILNLPMTENKDLRIIPIMDVQDIFVGNRKYYDLINGEIKLQDLNEYPLIFQKLPSNTRSFLDGYLKYNKAKLRPKLEVVSYNLIMDLVKSGFGIGYATKEFIKDELENKTLYEIAVVPSVPKRYIGIAIMSQSIPNYSVKKLIDTMTKNNLS
jgi:DNA-binding transcriptional LysR family regulator